MKKGLAGISLITMSVLYGILAIIIIPVCYYSGVSVLFTLLILIAAIVLQFLISPFLTDLSMRWFYRARFDMEMPAYLKEFIIKVCQEHNMKYPRIGYINDGAPNAFTYGHTKNDARIVLTRGTFELLSEDEVKAVVGHELGHAVHYDMALMTIAQLVPLILYAVYEIFAKDVDSSDKNESKLAVIGYVAYILYIICQYVILWFSRVREYYADSFSAEELKNPNLLASALVKIGYGLSASAGRDGKLSVSSKNTLGIFDSRTSKTLIVSSYNNGEVSKDKIKSAMKWEMWNVWAKWYELNSTHPLISKRLMALSNMSSKYGMEPYIKFDLEKTESYVDDFLVEILIKFLPVIVFIVGFSFVLFTFGGSPDNTYIVSIGVVILLTGLSSFITFGRKYPNSNYKETTVDALLGEVKVSEVTAIPCILNGKIIGRGNPGCIFNEDFVIQDNTGIVFLDYNQPFYIINKIFALFKAGNYVDKNIVVKGWYRRSPVPYVEIKSMVIDGKTKKCHTYLFSKLFIWLLVIASLFMIYFGMIS